MIKDDKKNQLNLSNIDLIKNVKSSFILNKIFSFLDISIKLQIIKYNKSHQKKLNIDIVDYIELNGRYIKYFNGKGIEMLLKKNIKIFEGEYFEGKRNGKGKEYNWKGILTFEGEYLNNRKWKGEGEEYDNFGHLIFKGKYSDGKQTTGNKYRYDIMSKKLRYEGIYKNGKANFERYYNKKGDLFAEIIYENGKIKKCF